MSRYQFYEIFGLLYDEIENDITTAFTNVQRDQDGYYKTEISSAPFHVKMYSET